jgi:hypothetical protein
LNLPGEFLVSKFVFSNSTCTKRYIAAEEKEKKLAEDEALARARILDVE